MIIDDKINITIKNSKQSNVLEDHIIKKREIINKYFKTDSNNINKHNINQDEDINKVISNLLEEIKDLKNTNTLLSNQIELKQNELDKQTIEINQLNEKILNINNKYVKLNEDKNNINDKYNNLITKTKVFCFQTLSLQKKIKILELNNKESSNNIENIQNYKLNNKILQDEISYYKKIIENIKKMIKDNLDYDNDLQKNNIKPNIDIDKIINNFTLEIKRLLKSIDLLSSREEFCNKKWNELLTENDSLRNKIKDLESVIQLTKSEYKSIINNNIYSLLNKINNVINSFNSSNSHLDFNKKSAAIYLTENIENLIKEKEFYISNNINKDQEIISLKEVIKELKVENAKFNKYFISDISNSNIKYSIIKIIYLNL